jgi:hypothetical protein
MNEEFPYLLLFQLVVAEEVDPLLGGGGGEALARAFEMLEDLLHGDVLLQWRRVMNNAELLSEDGTKGGKGSGMEGAKKKKRTRSTVSLLMASMPLASIAGSGLDSMDWR